MADEVRLPVRTLVEFLLRSGSIDNRFGSFVDRASEGARIHRRLQKSEGPGYRAEVFLSIKVERDGVTYAVGGRADGIFTDADGVPTIDEIKTTTRPLELIGEDFDRAHWGQAMCYAYFHALREGLDPVGARLRYVQVDTGQAKCFARRFSLEELRAFFDDLLRQYAVWADRQRAWRKVRNQSVEELGFPFQAYRPGQRELAVAVYRTVERGGRLFAQAPTGIGKTMSTLFPAVKALGAGKAGKIFYLTAKTISRQSARDALGQMAALGLRLKSVVLTAKDKICLLEERDCNPEKCPYADGYYDRANDAVFDLLERHDCLTRETLEEAAREKQICPFEIALDLALWCDAVVCDYNYLFDPVVSLRRFFSEEGGDYTFLIDEAHNLVDRAREMYSASLAKSDFLALRRLCGTAHKPLRAALARVGGALRALGRACGQEEGELVTPGLPEGLAEPITGFSAACGEWLQGHRDSPIRPQVLDLYFKAQFYLRIAELFDTHYVSYTAKSKDDVEVRLLCVDPCELLDACMARGKASVLFSATLSPAEYYVSVLGGGENAKKISIASPFPAENLCVLVASRVSTRYADRGRSRDDVAGLLCSFIAARRGNYLFFFPSYQYMREVYEAYRALGPDADTIVQQGGMDEGAREAFLARFTEGNIRTLAGFCVLGGIYSEGIDLKGERLIGTAVVGVGLPQIGTQRDILRDYFNARNGMGFAFAYRYPGMNKVLQAAGRVIRSGGDRGAVLLIDDRFATAAYRRLFPAHWLHSRAVRDRGELEEALRQFWRAP